MQSDVVVLTKKDLVNPDYHWLTVAGNNDCYLISKPIHVDFIEIVLDVKGITYSTIFWGLGIDGSNQYKGKEDMQFYTYFITSDIDSTQIKIGKSMFPEMRLRELQVGSKIPLYLIAKVPESMHTEHELHKRFAHLRGIGEWFYRAPELVDFIATLPNSLWNVSKKSDAVEPTRFDGIAD